MKVGYIYVTNVIFIQEAVLDAMINLRNHERITQGGGYKINVKNNFKKNLKNKQATHIIRNSQKQDRQWKFVISV